MNGNPLSHHCQPQIDAMEAAGYTVKLDRLSNGAFRCRVSRRGSRANGPYDGYNQHTTSTSSMSTAISAAHTKWRARQVRP